MFFCAGRTELFEFAEPIGVGLVESSIRLTKKLTTPLYEKIVFIGSAGSYGEVEVGEICKSTKAYNVELSSLLKKSFTPIEDFVEIGNVPHGTLINSSNYITSSKDSSELFLGKGLEIENMEAFSFLSVAKHCGLDAEVILIVTNYCHEDAHREYLSNLKSSMKKLEEYVREYR
ncbi:MAG: purine-nucleoside phosphorylase [Campylobacterales bacterium]